jgi:hypothetical protein
MRKLGLRNVAELTLVALESGLIERPGSVSRLFNSNGSQNAEDDKSSLGDWDPIPAPQPVI